MRYPIVMSHRPWQALLLAILLLLALSACGLGQEALPEPTPTRTPHATFTPTPEGQVANAHLFQTPVAAESAATTVAMLPTDTPTPIPTDTPIPEPTATFTPEPTPTPQAPVIFSGQVVNVRSGPGTNYGAVGQISPNQRYTITGKNQASTWWQIDFNGREGWVIDDLVSSEGVFDGVQVASAPPPPPTATRRPPTATPVPAATQPPARRYEFNIAVVGACRRQPGGNWFAGTVYKGGQPANGYRVVFSYAADGPWATGPAISGPHPGYENWAPGYYSHIISAAGAIAGTWHVWIVDPNGARISEIASWTSTGPGEGCNEAVVDFDSR